MAAPIYEQIGVGYSEVRREDPRLRAQLHAALGDARSVLNVGAGTGSYEPTDRAVVAVEPSPRMISQRPPHAGPVVRAFADRLPFADRAFGAVMASLTIHHWPDAGAGLAEMRRMAAGPVVVFTFDPRVHLQQWLVTEYLPELADFDAEAPPPEAVADMLGGGRVQVVPVPHDCVDGFCHAWWRRPEAYLSPAVRAGISGIARQPAAVIERFVAHLAADLADGTWERRHADLLALEELDAGYRLVIADAQ